MKTFLQTTLALSMLCAFPAMATESKNIHKDVNVKSLRNPIENIGLKDIKTVAPGTRSIEDPETVFTADEATFFYYQNLYTNGNDGYYLVLSNAGIGSNGGPLGEGQMAQLLIVTEPTDGSPILPVGTFEVSSTSGKAGTIDLQYSVFYDLFYYAPDGINEGLYAYSYDPEEGSLTISVENGIYHIVGEFDGYLYNESNQVIDQRPCKVEYTGPIEMVDNSYPEIEGDIVLNIPNLSGRYEEGDFSLAFYSVPLDEEGFIIGAGQLFNVELFVEDKKVMDINSLLGTYTVLDAFEEPLRPGTFMKGVWYQYYENIYFAIGTALTIYDETVEVVGVSLAYGGTITVSQVGEDVLFEFDLINAEGNKMTGSWKGNAAAYIENFGGSTSVKSIKEGVKIFGGKGFISAPEDAEVYSMNGVRVDKNNLVPGIYLVKSNNTVKKVVVK